MNSQRASLFVAAGVAAAAGLLAGCGHFAISQYISPRVTGRVVDAQTRQPLAGVDIRRVGQAMIANGGDLPKGGQVMERPAPVVTGPDGTFVVDSQRAFAIFRSVGWYNVALSFEREGYLQTSTNFTLSNSTNTASGEPWVQAGDVPLQPLHP